MFEYLDDRSTLKPLQFRWFFLANANVKFGARNKISSVCSIGQSLVLVGKGQACLFNFLKFFWLTYKILF